MNLTGLSAALNFGANGFALMWAKENLPAEEYQEIRKSYNTLMKRTIVFILACFTLCSIIFLPLIFAAPFSTRIETAATPNGATDYVLARVDYDGNFYWTHDSMVYKYALKEYGLSAEDYEVHDMVKVYINDAQNIIEVTTVEDGMDIRDIELLVGILGSILTPVILILIYRPFAYRTFGKAWIEFNRNF